MSNHRKIVNEYIIQITVNLKQSFLVPLNLKLHSSSKTNAHFKCTETIKKII